MPGFAALGDDVGFELADGDEIDVPGSMLYCYDGDVWPKCSLLICSFKKQNLEPEHFEGWPRWFYGRGYDARGGRLDPIPPKNLDEWKEIGEVQWLFYERFGVRAPGSFKHEFGRRRWQSMFKKGKLPILYRRGRAHRLELGAGCRVDERGVVHP